MDVLNLVLLRMDTLVLEDQLQVLILVLFVYQLEEVYLATKEVENQCEEMDLNMIWRSEMITIQIQMMAVVELELLRRGMLEVEGLYLDLILEYYAL